MLRSGIRSEILDLPVPSRHGKERGAANKKEIIPLELVQYHQYSKCISFALSVYLALFAALHASEALLAAINSSLSDD